MEDFNRIIESLSVRFIRCRHLDILQSVTVSNAYDVENTLIVVGEDSTITLESTLETAYADDILFIPAGRACHITFGMRDRAIRIGNEEFIHNREQYFRKHVPTEQLKNGIRFQNYLHINFEAKVFDSVSFFNSLDIPPFLIRGNKYLLQITREIARESQTHAPGRERVIQLQTNLLAIAIIRHILESNQFVEKLATNNTYFRDPRLIDIFTYIKNNLSGDLSNRVLAKVANVSEDYVGQYFKMLTGINPQDYIEYQRMEMAVKLLRTTKKSIRAIGNEVGYKDTAYFCRRFKMMFGIPAGKMRRRESLLNI
ncbi:MAG: AraC family transcriptional regulator [Cytophagales bacterium]|nr:AraC family transcriptional regulator [Bernardetiaceae bacterium]MDW8203629.1 AraC family transcriptional regulator [Cytophagales bacterium]